MKTKLLFILWVCCALVAKAEPLYFYPNGKKVVLKEIPNRTIIQGSRKDISAYQNIIKTGIVTKDVFYATISGEFKKKNNVLTFPLYTANNDTLIFINRVAAEIYPEFLNKEFKDYIDELGYTITEYLFPNTPIVQTKDIGSAISLANTIYEKGWAVWAVPDYISSNLKPAAWDQQFYIADYYDNMNPLNPQIDRAWNITKGCSDIRVAVIDGGVPEHESLKDEFGNSRILPGYDATHGLPFEPHGIWCTGVIAASHTEHMKGIAPNVKIVPIKIFYIDDTGGSQSVSNIEIAKSIKWAFSDTGGRADILSNSWYNKKGNESSCIIQTIENAKIYGRGGDMSRGRQGKGCVVVFCAGNSKQDTTIVGISKYAQHAIGVGAIHKDGTLAEFSQTGPGLDFVAFGKSSIYTLNYTGPGDMGNNYRSSFHGTSAACPQISGIAALMLSANPDLTQNQVKQILINNAIDMGAPGWDEDFGHGLVNGFGAVLDAVRMRAWVNLTEHNGNLVKYYLNLNRTLGGKRGNFPQGNYVVDIYKSSVTIPYYTPWIWLVGDGVSASVADGEKTFLSVEEGNEQTTISTYYWYIKKNRTTGDTVNRWYPVDPAIGHKFLVKRPPLPRTVVLDSVIHTGDVVEVKADSSIVLERGFATEPGVIFKASIVKNVVESDFINCYRETNE